MRKILAKSAVGLAACAVALVSPASRANAPERQALWLAVHACVADYKLTGAAFPCLMVDLKGGERRGYVVLRAPLDPDTILTPTRKVSGIEDPWLRSRAAPNYFADAWRARSVVQGPDAAPDDFALAVNSERTRSQDQFHIHLGCLAPAVKRWLPALAPRLPVGAWTRAGAFWALRTGSEDPAEVRPLRLAAEAIGVRMNFARMMMLVSQVRIAGRAETLILVAYPDASGEPSSESMLDPTCGDGSRASAAR